MPKHGKNYRGAATALEADTTLDPKAAIEHVKEMAFAKFDETVDVAVRLGVDPRHADQIVRGTVILPAGTGRTVRVLALAQGEKAREAEEAGAVLGPDQHAQERLLGQAFQQFGRRRARLLRLRDDDGQLKLFLGGTAKRIGQGLARLGHAFQLCRAGPTPVRLAL